MAGITKKLLYKTLRAYILFSILVMMIAAPLFYFITERLYIEDADEALVLQKMEFIHYALPEIKTSDIAIWNSINRDIKIEAAQQNLSKDSIFYNFIFDSLANENEPYRVLLAPITIDGNKYTFYARINLVESEDLVESIAVLFCIILTLLLIGLYVITRRLSTTLWQPFYNALESIEKFEIDKNIKPLSVETQIEEFNRLNQTFNKLMERNITIYQNQQEFIENAAHELQTPLAVFQSKLDTLIQQPTITENEAEILLKLNESAARLNRLNKNLLLLSKIDNNIYSEKEDVSLEVILKKQLEFFIEQAEDKKINIEVEVDDPGIIHSNLPLLEILISNLLLNAIKHNMQSGEIQVKLKHRSLTITNTGNSSPLPAGKLFQRFSKTDSSTKGSGLGLAIVKKIADANSWKVFYSFENNQHVFTVNF